MNREWNWKIAVYRSKRIAAAGRSTPNMSKINELFYLDTFEANGVELYNFSFGSVWLTFHGHALVAINRYNIEAHRIEAFVVRTIDPANSPALARPDYVAWVDKLDLKMFDMEEEFTIPQADWEPIGIAEIHAKAAQWMGDQVSLIVQDRLTGGN